LDEWGRCSAERAVHGPATVGAQDLEELKN
jgi:hypothetical protein